ncbi:MULTISPECIES: hypothetical protein [Vibrio]|uniref:Uncharacterized protein n=11 Tax=Vibrio anguillarum TaxID=55601 RepID=A0A289GH94_VIBAN|nr:MULTISPECIES: hypothetical protein [Vibrio]ASW82771.1 hypothetical protein CK207_17120 [Vibrio anguillarum]AZS26960.1 hypothetical protein DYL72_18605 [Vibrio anguillarum]MBF4291344.1 hypothetical protein [Vibrio anguillarum]MBF4308344.1 hypothetical protein [Vibrio anguillarum]MBF4326332.1 hypothetical protein [Vibrio anguillarum]
MTIFEPGVQYKDLNGGVHADRDDTQDATDYLRQHHNIPQDHFVFGIQVYSSVHHVRDNTLSVRFLHSNVAGYENIQQKMVAEGAEFTLNELEIGMSYKEFFGLFKRFSLTLSPNGLLEGKSYKTV